MKTASITEAKNGLSHLLDIVRHGDSVLILDRHRPVARLEPVAGVAGAADGGRVLRLARAGLLQPARRAALPKGFSAERLPAAASSAVAALLAEREDGR